MRWCCAAGAWRPLPGARLTLISPDPTAPYTGMLPGLIAGHYRREALEIDLVRLARHAGARLILGPGHRARPRARGGSTSPGRPPISPTTSPRSTSASPPPCPTCPGFADHGLAAKPLGRLRRPLGRRSSTPGRRRRLPPQVAVIGAGVAGVELALAMAHALRPRRRHARGDADRARPGRSAASARRRGRGWSAALAAAGIALTRQRRASAGGRGRPAAASEGGRSLPAALTVGAAGARAAAPGWRDTGLPLTDGFVDVDADLQVRGHRRPFRRRRLRPPDRLARGPRPGSSPSAPRRCCTATCAPRCPAGRCAAFRPQRRLPEADLAGRQGGAWPRNGACALAGPGVWRWKDRIDRRFMARFTDLPPMPPPRPPALACRGRGRDAAPTGRSAAAAAPRSAATCCAASLAALPQLRDDVLTGAGDDAAVLAVGGARQVLTTDHLRAFTEDPVVMTRIAALHALGDVWAMGAHAAGGAGLGHPAAAVAPAAGPHHGRDHGRRGRSLRRGRAPPSSAAIPRMGAELTLGFTVTGLLDGPPITHAGAPARRRADPDPADRLGRAPGGRDGAGGADGRDVAALLADDAATAGARRRRSCSGAHAMTDVTGFGLAGHLLAICRASGCGAEIDLDAVPLYAGAEALAAAGHRSTLYAANRRRRAGRGRRPARAPSCSTIRRPPAGCWRRWRRGCRSAAGALPGPDSGRRDRPADPAAGGVAAERRRLMPVASLRALPAAAPPPDIWEQRWQGAGASASAAARICGSAARSAASSSRSSAIAGHRRPWRRGGAGIARVVVRAISSTASSRIVARSPPAAARRRSARPDGTASAPPAAPASSAASPTRSA